MQTQVLSMDKKTGRDVYWVLPPVDNASTLLAEWIAAYLYGQRQPLPLFPKTGRAYATELDGSPEGQHKANIAAQGIWSGNDYSSGDGTKPVHQYVYRGHSPVHDEDFSLWSELLYKPMLDHVTTDLPSVMEVQP